MTPRGIVLPHMLCARMCFIEQGTFEPLEAKLHSKLARNRNRKLEIPDRRTSSYRGDGQSRDHTSSHKGVPNYCRIGVPIIHSLRDKKTPLMVTPGTFLYI